MHFQGLGLDVTADFLETTVRGGGNFNYLLMAVVRSGDLVGE